MFGAKLKHKGDPDPLNEYAADQVDRMKHSRTQSEGGLEVWHSGVARMVVISFSSFGGQLSCWGLPLARENTVAELCFLGN